MIPVYRSIVDEITDICEKAKKNNRTLEHIKLTRAEFYEFYKETGIEENVRMDFSRCKTDYAPVEFNGVWLYSVYAEEGHPTQKTGVQL